MEYSKTGVSNLVIGIIVLWSFNSNGCDGVMQQGPSVKVDQGTLEGITVTTKSGFQYDSYQGIPYAKPPIGDLRFRDPYPAGRWYGILNATAPGSACTQYDPLFQNKYYGTENCLFLNVYVPKTCGKPKDLAVIVWIHGGGFIVGDGDPVIYGPGLFVENDVIVVTINYRLGVFGFLSLNTPDVPGNAGMKDQVLALKWVQKNIYQFGGNPKKVTIFGESAGAASVHYHVLSKMSEGLFRGAIMQSGSSLCPWALQRDQVGIAKEVVRVLRKGEDIKDISKFLRTIPERDLVFAALSPNLIGKINLSFAPTIEKCFPNIVPFISCSPEEIINSGKFNKVSTITGLAINEGLIYRTIAFSVPEDIEAMLKKRIPGIKKFVPDELKAQYGNGTEKIEEEIQNYYFPTTDNLSNNLTNLYTDFAFAKDAISSVKLFAKYSYPAYFYRFSYSGSVNLLRLITDLQYTGSAHTDEIPYMFDVELNGINKIPLTPSDKLISKRLLEMWTNFAKFRNPTPRETPTVPLIWPPVIVKDTDVITLDIDSHLKLIPNPFAERLKFWDHLTDCH